MELEFRRVLKKDDYRTIAYLIYHTDPFIYSDLFGDYESAERVIMRLLDTEKSIFHRNNYYVAISNEDIAGIAAFYNKVEWDSWSVEEAFYLESVKIPESFSAASEYFDFTFNHAMKFGVNACNIIVAEKCRRHGVASFLLDNLIKISGKMDLELNVLANNTPAIELYKKHGFEVIKKFKDYGGYKNDPVDCFNMIHEAPKEG